VRRIAVGVLVADADGAHAAGRLVRSLRWFGGQAATAAVAVVSLIGLDAETARLFAAEGVVVHGARADWRTTMAEVVAALDVDTVLLAGSDALILQDPTAELAPDRVHVLPSERSTVSDEARRHAAALCAPGAAGFRDYEPSLVAAPPRELAVVLRRWLELTETILRAPALRAELGPWFDAIAFSLALATCGARRTDLPVTMGLAAHAPLPAAWDPTIDPVIVRAASAGTDGRVAYAPYPFAQARLERLNRRLAGYVRPTSPPTGCTGQPCAQVVVLGMHRSGTSMLTGLLALAGLHAGAEEDFPPPDAHNRRGYWELLDVWAIDEALLRLLGATWDDPGACDLSRLAAADRVRLAARAERVVARLDRHGPWVVKDPRLCLLLPFWRPWLSRPVSVLVYRDPRAVARSLAARDGHPPARGTALWERYTRAALAASADMPRVVVAQRDLLADPRGTMERLVGALARAGVRGLVVPTAAALAARVEPSLAHQDVAAETIGPLTPAQAALLAALERERVAGSGSV
jgi:hypothetical protein